jgi:hypothetical protein
MPQAAYMIETAKGIRAHGNKRARSGIVEDTAPQRNQQPNMIAEVTAQASSPGCPMPFYRGCHLCYRLIGSGPAFGLNLGAF